MHAPVGVNLEFDIPLHVEDIDSETLIVICADETNPLWISVVENTIQGTPNDRGCILFI